MTHPPSQPTAPPPPDPAPANSYGLQAHGKVGGVPHPPDPSAAPVLEGVRALVTGGTSGLGFAMSQALAEAGARVALTGRTEQRVQDAAAKITRVTGLVMDVRDERSVSAGVDRALAILGGVDVLVDNAGIGMRTVNPDFMSEPAGFWPSARTASGTCSPPMFSATSWSRGPSCRTCSKPDTARSSTSRSTRRRCAARASRLTGRHARQPTRSPTSWPPTSPAPAST